MKRTFTLITLVFATVSLAIAQTDLQLSAGWSLPLGKFSKRELGEGGFAKPGMALTFEAAHKFRSNIGILGLVSYQEHPFDDNFIENEYKDLLPDYILSIRIDPFDYQSVLAMVGPFYQLDLGEYFNLRFKGGVGLFHSRIGDQGLIAKVKDENTGGSKTIVRRATSTDSNLFSYFLGAAVNYEIRKWFYIKLDGLYSSADPEYTLTNIENVSETIDQKTAFININLGIVFVF